MLLNRIRSALRRSKTNTRQTPVSTPVHLIKVAPATKKKRANSNWITKWAYKPGTKEIDWGKVISTPIAIIGLAWFMIRAEKRQQKEAWELKNFPRYTIGVTIDTHRTRGTKYVDYMYSANGLHYKRNERYPSYNDNINVSGGRYFVKFSAKDASNAEMLFDHPVPYNIPAAPDSGWTSVPAGN